MSDDRSAAPPLPLRAVRHLEETGALDALTAPLRGPLRAALARLPRTAGLLHGRPLGHALHPLMTDLPLGLWTSATVLDLVGGRSGRRHADHLLGLGILAAAPTALTGLADWSTLDRRSSRVGAVHAALNGAGLALYSTSWVLRRRDARPAAVLVSLAATGVVAASGYLGGHLSFRLGAPPRRHSGPPTTRPTADDDEIGTHAQPVPPTATSER